MKPDEGTKSIATLIRTLRTRAPNAAAILALCAPVRAIYAGP